jgi:hypothetical protein
MAMTASMTNCSGNPFSTIFPLCANIWNKFYEVLRNQQIAILAARLALQGAGWSLISRLVGGELLVGSIYILMGYLCFRLIERHSLVSGTLDAM